MSKITIDIKDVEKYLSPQSRYRLKMMIDSINLGRKTDGKSPMEELKVMDYEYDPFMNRGKY